MRSTLLYRSLIDNILREGDLLVVTDLKRFGRNCGEIYREWFHITKEIGAEIGCPLQGGEELVQHDAKDIQPPEECLRGDSGQGRWVMTGSGILSGGRG